MPSNVIMADAKGAGSLTLVDEYIATENVSEIIMSGDFGNYDYYIIVFTGQTSANEWIYVLLDPTSTEKSRNYLNASGSGQTGTSTYTPENATLTLTKEINGLSTPLYHMLLGTNTNVGALSTMNLTYIKCFLYSAASRFVSGFSVKLYGGYYLGG